MSTITRSFWVASIFSWFNEGLNLSSKPINTSFFLSSSSLLPACIYHFAAIFLLFVSLLFFHYFLFPLFSFVLILISYLLFSGGCFCKMFFFLLWTCLPWGWPRANGTLWRSLEFWSWVHCKTSFVTSKVTLGLISQLRVTECVEAFEFGGLVW